MTEWTSPRQSVPTLCPYRLFAPKLTARNRKDEEKGQLPLGVTIKVMFRPYPMDALVDWNANTWMMIVPVFPFSVFGAYGELSGEVEAEGEGVGHNAKYSGPYRSEMVM